MNLYDPRKQGKNPAFPRPHVQAFFKPDFMFENLLRPGLLDILGAILGTLVQYLDDFGHIIEFL